MNPIHDRRRSIAMQCQHDKSGCCLLRIVAKQQSLLRAPNFTLYYKTTHFQLSLLIQDPILRTFVFMQMKNSRIQLLQFVYFKSIFPWVGGRVVGMCAGVWVCFHFGSNCFNFIYCTHVLTVKHTQLLETSAVSMLGRRSPQLVLSLPVFINLLSTNVLVVCSWSVVGQHRLHSVAILPKHKYPQDCVSERELLSFLKQPQHGKSLIGTET